jgi:hypothetical protein
MAKNDYFVIVYKMLKYLYDCLKSGISPNYEMFDADRLGIPESYRNCIMANLYEDRYITGAVFILSACGMPDKGLRTTKNTKITPKDIRYLEENAFFQKSKAPLRTLPKL